MSNLQLGSSGSPAKNFHGVGIGPLSKILAVKSDEIFHNVPESNAIKYLPYNIS